MPSSAPRGPTEPALRRPSSAERPLATGASSSPSAGRAPGATASPSGSSEATGKPRGRDGRPRREEDDVPPEEKRLRLLLEGEAHSPRTARTGRTRRGRAGRRRAPRQVATAEETRGGGKRRELWGSGQDLEGTEEEAWISSSKGHEDKVTHLYLTCSRHREVAHDSVIRFVQ
ncbi:junctional sarcoplasmic reticulum protein 1-like [Pan paniscus]|uniref:junctional sarcoplasmic reticulum protein 1-like n=1 Tax=Pan paniscus TaxID=9597 RepID=UPI003006BB40